MSNFARTLIAAAISMAATSSFATNFYFRVPADAKCSVSGCAMHPVTPPTSGGGGTTPPVDPTPPVTTPVTPAPVDANLLVAQARAYIKGYAQCAVIGGYSDCSNNALVWNGDLSAYPQTAVGDAWGNQMTTGSSGAAAYSVMITRHVATNGTVSLGEVDFADLSMDAGQMAGIYSDYWSWGEVNTGAMGFSATLSRVTATACSAVAALHASDVSCSGTTLTVTVPVSSAGKLTYSQGDYTGVNTFVINPALFGLIAYPS